MAAFRWDNKKTRAAQLIADGDLTDEEIGREIGVTRQTLWHWRGAPEFDARVKSLIEDYAAAVRRRGIGVLERRVAALNDRWLRMQRVIHERAADSAMEDVPGGQTGLLVRQVKAVKVWGAEAADDDLADCRPTKESRVVEEYAVDTGLLNELRQHEQQAAKELGQWAERSELAVKGPVTIHYVNNWRCPDDPAPVPPPGPEGSPE